MKTVKAQRVINALTFMLQLAGELEYNPTTDPQIDYDEGMKDTLALLNEIKAMKEDRTVPAPPPIPTVTDPGLEV